MKLLYLVRKVFRLNCFKREIFEKFVEEIEQDINMSRTEEISLSEKYKEIRDHIKECKYCKENLDAYLHVIMAIRSSSWQRVKDGNVVLDKARAKIIKDIFLNLEIKPSELMQICVGAAEELLKEIAKKDTEKRNFT